MSKYSNKINEVIKFTIFIKKFRNKKILAFAGIFI